MDRKRGGFSQHDDRVGGPVWHGGRGGRGGRGRGGRGNRGREVNPRTHFDDDDSDMVESGGYTRGQKNRYRPYGDRSSSDRNRSQSNDGSNSVFNRLGGLNCSGGSAGGSSVFTRLSGLGEGDTWHKITIQKGGLESQEWLIKKLASSISETFEPIGIHVLGDKLMFFIAQSRAATQLRELASIQSRNGELTIFVKCSPPPRGSTDSLESRQHRGAFESQHVIRSRQSDAGDISMQEDVTVLIQGILGQRYNPGTKSLDLSNMYNDSDFKEGGIKVSMFDRNVVSTILTLLGKYCPDLLSIDLSNNRLQRLELYADLSAKCSDLQVLNLSQNQIRSFGELEHLTGLSKLSTLVLENNPLSEKGADFVVFSSNMRKIFPALQLLNGQQLSSPVKFDLPVSLGKLPSVEKSYLVNDDVKTLVATFLEQYYMIYDNESREKLLEAYSNDAIFSFSACTGGTRTPGMQEYFTQSRNLLKVKDQGRRMTLLKRGRIDIVQFLRDLPNTRHFSKTFTVDVVSATPLGTAFVVNGMFSEVDGRLSGKNPVLAFTRMFVVSAVGNGVAVSNDQLTIRSPTQQGLKYVQDELGKVQEVHAMAPVQSVISASTNDTYSSAQIEAVHRLSKESRMNPEWSRKCLDENGWDFGKSVTVFTLLQSQGRIPEEAFL